MNLRFAFLVTGKYLNSALEKMAYVDDSRKEHCMWKYHGTGDPGELQSDVNLQYFLLVTGRNLDPALNKIAYVDELFLLVTDRNLDPALNKVAYECVKENTACGSSTGEETQGGNARLQ